MTYFFQEIVSILSCNPFLLATETLSLLIKIYIIVKLFVHRTENRNQFKRAWFLLILILWGSTLEDIAWIIKLLQLSVFPNLDYRLVIFMVRLAWLFAVIQCQALVLLIQSLIPTPNRQLSSINYIFLLISSIYCGIFLWLIFFKTIYLERPPLEFITLTQVAIYIPILTLINLIIGLVRLRQNKVPKILKKQLNIFILGLIGPRIISDTIQNYPFNIMPDSITNNYSVIALYSLLLAYTAYFCINSMMRLRFLNFKQHVVAANSDEYFMDRFKHFLEQLSKAMTPQELRHIVKTYFKEVLNIPDGKINLFIRSANNNESKAAYFFASTDMHQNIKENVVENFISTNQAGVEHLRETPTLVLDEIEFNYFYQASSLNHDLLKFLGQINSEIFVPIYQDEIMIAYIIIEHDPYSKRLYSNIERDEIAIFAKYLGNIINLMQKRSLDALIEQEKALKEELYQKHQQINQYKESIKSFIKQSHHKKKGI